MKKRNAPSRSAGKKKATFPELEAGRYHRRLANWTPSRAHINTQIGASGRTVLARARYLVRNNGYAMGATECFAGNLIGSGIVPSWKIKGNDTLRNTIHDAWLAWTDECDAEGVADFYSLQRRIGRELFIAGECFVRQRPRYASDGLSVPLQIELLPSEQLPIERNLFLANGNRVRQGIEFDQIGRRVAYHFWKVHPGDVTQSQFFGQITIIPADQILHIHDPLESGQIRGLPKLTPAIVPLWSLDAYDDAELERKKTAALFSIFITRADAAGPFFKQEQEDKAQQNDGVADVQLTPGAAHTLLQGEDVKVAGPADVGPNYEQFQYRSLAKFCAAVGLPYHAVTGDTSRANYSSMRSAILEARRRLEALQFGVVVFQMCRPIAQWFLDAAVLSGALDLPDYNKSPQAYRKIDWVPPRWDWVDPLKDIQAEVISVNNGFKSRSSVIAGMGGVATEVDAESASDQRRADSLGLKFVGTPTPARDIAAPPPDAADEAIGNNGKSDNGTDDDEQPSSPPSTSAGRNVIPLQRG